MLRFFLFSLSDALDGADAATLFGTGRIGTTINTIAELSRSFPTANVVAVPGSDLVDPLRTGDVDYAINGFLYYF